MTTGDWWIVGTVFLCTMAIAPGIDAINRHLRTIIGLLNDIKHGRRD